MIRRPVAWITAVMGVAIVGALIWLRQPPEPAPTDAEPSLWADLAPLPRRVKVEVLNATRVNGLARTITVRLREAGLDVVAFGGAEPGMAALTRSQILVRRGDTLGVGRILLLLPDADLRDEASATRLVDLTVVLASDSGIPDRP